MLIKVNIALIEHHDDKLDDHSVFLSNNRPENHQAK